jgi:hypothetical protein
LISLKRLIIWLDRLIGQRKRSAKQHGGPVWDGWSHGQPFTGNGESIGILKDEEVVGRRGRHRILQLVNGLPQWVLRFFMISNK